MTLELFFLKTFNVKNSMEVGLKSLDCLQLMFILLKKMTSIAFKIELITSSIKKFASYEFSTVTSSQKGNTSFILLYVLFLKFIFYFLTFLIFLLRLKK